jgi:pyridoxal phosphate enzyme (YggS family)
VSSSRVDSLAARLSELRERIARAAERSGRPADAVRLVGVSKTVSVERLTEAIAAGLEEVGESRVQEAEPKLDAIEVLCAAGELPRPVWHFVGHLQRNKARRVAARFDGVQSVDSPGLAKALGRHASDLGRELRVWIEVNVAGEHQKTGAAVADVPALVDMTASEPHLVLCGFMTVGPRVESPEAAREAFRAMAAVAERERGRRPELALAELSMGMSSDFEVAIEEGATMVRIGSALFGARD